MLQNIFEKNQNIEVLSEKYGYLGDGYKTLKDTSIDIVTGFYPGSIGGKMGNSLSPYLQNTTEKMLSESIISMPFVFLD
jgi:hypothetical protein